MGSLPLKSTSIIKFYKNIQKTHIQIPIMQRNLLHNLLLVLSLSVLLSVNATPLKKDNNNKSGYHEIANQLKNENECKNTDKCRDEENCDFSALVKMSLRGFWWREDLSIKKWQKDVCYAGAEDRLRLLKDRTRKNKETWFKNCCQTCCKIIYEEL